MPVSIQCSCGTKLSAKDEWIGKRVKCPACNARHIVPPPARDAKQADEFWQLARKEREHSDPYVRLLEEGLKHDPDHQRCLAYLGVSLQRRKDFARAAPCLVQAANNATDPLDDRTVHDFRMNMLDRAATCYLEMGHYQEAARLWEHVLKEGRWSSNAAAKIRQDISAAKAKAAGQPAPARKYGPQEQGAGGINRVLNKHESGDLEDAIWNHMPPAQLLEMIISWGFSSADSQRLMADAILALGFRWPSVKAYYSQ
jgi:tetratricopeptide (TPR) repeat protein